MGMRSSRRCLTLVSILSLLSCAASALTLHVSPDGPLSSLEAARDAIRKRAVKEPVTVVVAGGTYALSGPIVFTPADSGTADAPIVYAAAEGARPVFSGGRRIAGFQAGADGVW